MMNSYERLISERKKIEALLGYSFQAPELLYLSFVHRSYVNENRAIKEHNERLEFLGDTVLGLIIANYLYERFPAMAEGHLSQLRARLVDASTCGHFFQKLDIQDFILLGKGESLSEGRGKESISADVFEALMAAIYLDGGYEEAKRFFLRHFKKDIEEILKSPSRNFKAELQDYSQRKYQKPPLYKVLKEEGPDHSKIFYVVVCVNEEQIAEGSGSSKKEAEQKAAEEALHKLEAHLKENS
jgi:ribonuclease-3